MNRPPYRDAWTWLEHDSALLAQNQLDDRTHRRFPVYLPPQYLSEPNRRFPVAYYLCGFGGWSAMKLLEEKAWEEPLWARLDRQMLTGEIAPMLVVFPDCFTRLGGAQYRDSPVAAAPTTRNWRGGCALRPRCPASALSAPSRQSPATGSAP